MKLGKGSLNPVQKPQARKLSGGLHGRDFSEKLTERGGTPPPRKVSVPGVFEPFPNLDRQNQMQNWIDHDYCN